MGYTIQKIQSEMTARGSHWWDRGTMRFFRCRVAEQVYQGPGGIYFVSSEKGWGDDAKRQYTVRQYHPATHDIDTVGEFNELSRSQAHRIAAKLAATSLADQFTQAMIDLDRATTGSAKDNHVTQYGTLEAARDGEVLYLSDGGYTRCAAKQYDDGSGYYLSLIPTGSKAGQEAARAKFNDAYKLQQEVTRILKTEPAGETATVTKEAYREPSEAEQLALDVQRGGGHTNATQMAYMIRLATAHQKAMEDYCNIPDANVYDENGDPTPRLADLRSRIEELAKGNGCKGVEFSGDPRGCTVKLILPNGETNDWGKEGWCVPTKG